MHPLRRCTEVRFVDDGLLVQEELGVIALSFGLNLISQGRIAYTLRYYAI